ncbi:ATP-grasp domain-containing protein [Micromonospora sp. DT4]|uniref:ATP-grasp domain-containing protein n=1 Tax=Micromonospora sp. DT4 TaxID=3393438 RepID=UPI003CE76AB2
MNKVALVTDETSLPNDYDMALLLEACAASGLTAEVRDWEDPTTDWSAYEAVLLRSPWTYVDRLPAFLAWCERVAVVTELHNPLPVVRWSLNKSYMADLAVLGVPVVPSTIVSPDTDPAVAVQQFLAGHPEAKEIVVKPTVGAYSKDVQRFVRSMEADAAAHVARMRSDGFAALLQPYVESVDRDGETDLVYFDGVYSHAIRKSAMLMSDGTVKVPTFESRTAREADADERAVASAALAAAGAHLMLERPLVYARVDVIRSASGAPVVLELELCEPSLNLSFTDHGATRLAETVAARLKVRARR